MKKLSSKMMALLLAVILSCSLAACGSQSNVVEPSVEPTTEASVEMTGEEVAEETAEATVYPVSITDSYGDTITLESEPMKIVSVAPNLTEILSELGGLDKLVGRTDYCDFPEEVSAIDSIGTLYTPDIEKIISLEPDLVIVSTHFDEENSQKLKDLNIPVLSLYEEKDVTGVYNMILSLGQAVNKNAEAKACVEEMKVVVDEVTSKTEGLESPSVYYVVGYGEGGDFTAGGDTFVGGMIELAGGNNIAKEVTGWNITLEEIVEADPEIIVVAQSMKEDFMNTANYQDLTAVKEGKVYGIDNNILDRQSYRNAEGIKTLAEIFYPEVFK